MFRLKAKYSIFERSTTITRKKERHQASRFYALLTDDLTHQLIQCSLKSLNSLDFCSIPWTPGQRVKSLDNPGKSWTVGNYVRDLEALRARARRTLVALGILRTALRASKSRRNLLISV